MKTYIHIHASRQSTAGDTYCIMNRATDKRSGASQLKADSLREIMFPHGTKLESNGVILTGRFERHVSNLLICPRFCKWYIEVSK